MGIFSKTKYLKSYNHSPFLPMSQQQMRSLGWDSCDIILVSGDAYVDHPAFGVAIIARVLEAEGFRVGVIAQPDWHYPDDFCRLGKPNIMFGVTAGNMDSMVNHYTADRLKRSDDAYSPNGIAGNRPDRATITYCMRCAQAYPDVPIVIGGIEASLRRAAHFDYWSEKVRRSILLDSKADLLLYGNAERAVVEVANRLAKGERVETITDIRGTVFSKPHGPIPSDAIRLPSYEEVLADKRAFCLAQRIIQLNNRPSKAKILVQKHGDRDVWIMPPSYPLSTKEFDAIYELFYSRKPHPFYSGVKIPAWETTRFSVTIVRGCFGGCSFCSLGCHQGPIIQSRSVESVIREIEIIRDTFTDFNGIINDLGGPTANMYQMGPIDEKLCYVCSRFSCLYPSVCRNLSTDHSGLISLYRIARHVPGIRKVLISSGVRFDLALHAPDYIRELTMYHVGGHLKVAPEHISKNSLRFMCKPGIELYQKFALIFKEYSKEAAKEQYILPYFIAAHPGTTNNDMVELALWMKRNKIHVDQVQSFLPSPMTLATAMYYSGINPLDPNLKEKVFVANSLKTRRIQKAFCRWHDANNWPLIRKALRQLKREDLIGDTHMHLVPSWQPGNTATSTKKKRKGRFYGINKTRYS